MYLFLFPYSINCSVFHFSVLLEIVTSFFAFLAWHRKSLCSFILHLLCCPTALIFSLSLANIACLKTTRAFSSLKIWEYFFHVNFHNASGYVSCKYTESVPSDYMSLKEKFRLPCGFCLATSSLPDVFMKAEKSFPVTSWGTF